MKATLIANFVQHKIRSVLKDLENLYILVFFTLSLIITSS